MSGPSIREFVAQCPSDTATEFSLPALPQLFRLPADLRTLRRATNKEARAVDNSAERLSFVGGHQSSAGYPIAASPRLSSAGKACSAKNERGDCRRPLRSGNSSGRRYFFLPGAPKACESSDRIDQEKNPRTGHYSVRRTERFWAAPLSGPALWVYQEANDSHTGDAPS